MEVTVKMVWLGLVDSVVDMRIGLVVDAVLEVVEVVLDIVELLELTTNDTTPAQPNQHPQTNHGTTSTQRNPASSERSARSN